MSPNQRCESPLSEFVTDRIIKLLLWLCLPVFVVKWTVATGEVVGTAEITSSDHPSLMWRHHVVMATRQQPEQQQQQQQLVEFLMQSWDYEYGSDIRDATSECFLKHGSRHGCVDIYRWTSASIGQRFISLLIVTIMNESLCRMTSSIHVLSSMMSVICVDQWYINHRAADITGCCCAVVNSPGVDWMYTFYSSMTTTDLICRW